MPKSKLRTKLNKKPTVKKQLVKHSQKSNLLLFFALFLAIIAIGSYITYKSTVRPIGINEVGSSSTVTCSQGFTDNFDNVDYLSTYTMDDPIGIKIENGLATFNSTAGSRIRTKIFSGNFVVILTISDSNSVSAIPVMVVRYLDDPNIDSIGVKIKYDKTIGKIQSFRVTSPDGKTGTFDLEKSLPIETSEPPSAYKVERQGSTFLVYFKTINSDFQLIGAYDNLTTKDVSIRFGADNSEKTVFDSLTISCLPSPKPPTPSNPRSTCNPDGKSVRLMWDGVGSANSYKVRVDDKGGKVTPFDGISKTEYIANISPNQTYSWWAHATKDGIDSAETPRLEFRCTPTSTPTPTPKPTVKPTIAPTVTPTITPTSTPTNSTYVAPNTTKAQTFELPVEPASTPLPAKSTNPISRFFSWLASLFE